MLRADAWALHQVLAELFIASFATAPKELSLDVDASDVPLHGGQELKPFYGYYDHHCYLPLYVFCGQLMLVCLLRPRRIDDARHAAAVLKRDYERTGRKPLLVSEFTYAADAMAE